jgi:hypothetical protein
MPTQFAWARRVSIAVLPKNPPLREPPGTLERYALVRMAASAREMLWFSFPVNIVFFFYFVNDFKMIKNSEVKYIQELLTTKTPMCAGQNRASEKILLTTVNKGLQPILTNYYKNKY